MRQVTTIAFEKRLRLAMIGGCALLLAVGVAITADLTLRDPDTPAIAGLPAPWNPPSPVVSASPPDAPPASATPSHKPSRTPERPKATRLAATRKLTGAFDGRNATFVGADALDAPLFTLADGASLSNVVIGAPAADGVHCQGSCTLRNVQWLDAGRTAATFAGTSAGQTMSVIGGGAAHASDVVFEHDGPGTMVIAGFEAADIGSLYRSCAACERQFARRVQIADVKVTGPMKTLAGINYDLGDSATITRATLVGGTGRNVCSLFRAVTGGAPVQLSNVPDGVACRASAISLN